MFRIFANVTKWTENKWALTLDLHKHTNRTESKPALLHTSLTVQKTIPRLSSESPVCTRDCFSGVQSNVGSHCCLNTCLIKSVFYFLFTHLREWHLYLLEDVTEWLTFKQSGNRDVLWLSPWIGELHQRLLSSGEENCANAFMAVSVYLKCDRIQTQKFAQLEISWNG